MFKINLNFDSYFNTKLYTQNNYKKPINLVSQDCFIRSCSNQSANTNRQISFLGSVNIDKFSSSFTPNKTYEKLNDPNDKKIRKSSEPIKVGTVTIFDKKTKKPVNATVCYSYSKIEKGEIFELYNNNKCIGKIALCQEIDNSYNGIPGQNCKTIQLFDFDNYARGQFSNIGSELVGIGIRRSSDLGCKGRVTLTAYNESMDPKVLPDNPIGFYYEKGFRLKRDKHNLSRFPDLTYSKIDDEIKDALERKFKGEINTQQVKSLLDKFNWTHMYLPEDSIKKWLKILDI